MELLAARSVGTLVRVRPKVIALSLQQVGRQAAAAVTIEVGQRRRESRDGKALLDGRRDDSTPGRLCFLDRLPEEVVQQKVFQVRVLVKRVLDVLQEDRTNDAATSPQQRDRAVVQLPAELLRGRIKLDVALRVTAKL